MRKFKTGTRGFTLVELMIVVAIVGILAVLGVVGYSRIISSSHATEARNVLGSIRMAQESRRAETGSFATPSPGGFTQLCPSAGTGPKVNWNTACASWSLLPVKTDGPVRYGYSSVSGRGNSGNVPAVPGQGQAQYFPALVWPTNPQVDWYVAFAELDENGNGTFSRGVASSFTNEIWVVNEGE